MLSKGLSNNRNFCTESGPLDASRTETIMSRFPRTLANLKIAIGDLPHVLVFDNTDMADPFRLIGKFHDGIDQSECERPNWLAELLK